MKIKTLIKPVIIGSIAYEASKLYIPHYSNIVAIGSGIYLLYSIIHDNEEKTPFVTGIIYNKTDNNILATIQNPSKKAFAFIPHIHLKEIIIPQEGMMTAATIPDKTTLIGETDTPSIIGPNETITVSCNLLIPQEMYENSNGSLSIKLSFEDVKESLEKITKTKVEEKLTQIENKIEDNKIKEAILIQTTVGKPTDIIHHMELTSPETAMSELPKIFKDETLISIVPENIHKAEEIINNFKESDLYSDSLKPASIVFNENHKGVHIGHSQSMLKLIVAMDRLKAINIGNDAI